MIEHYYKKQNDCDLYIICSNSGLYMVDDIVKILNRQRATIKHLEKANKHLEKEYMRVTNQQDELQQFKNLARDYNIPFDKLYDAFESNLNNDTTIALESQIATLKSENKRLENNIDELLRVDIISDLESEIVELKSENKKLNDNIDTFVDINADLETENSKLKQINYMIFQHIYNKLEEAFDKRVNAKSDSDIEYYKGYHIAIGDLKKEIVKELSDDKE